MLAWVCISSSTVRHRLLEAGRKAKKPLKKHLLTKKNEEEKIRMGKNTYKLDGRRLEESVFLNKTHFFVQGKHSQFARISKGEHLSLAHFNVVVKYPPKKMLWGSFSFSGVGSLMPIEGMMSSD